MDIPDTERVVAAAHRVSNPGGVLPFSILHPCFNTPQWRNPRNAQGLLYAIEGGDSCRNVDGEINQCLFATVPRAVKQQTPPFKIPLFTRTISQWVNLLIETGFGIECVAEPRPKEATVYACPAIQGAQVIAYFLCLQVRKR
jgi:hypothetical protein